MVKSVKSVIRNIFIKLKVRILYNVKKNNYFFIFKYFYTNLIFDFKFKLTYYN